jgi:hypothetical protein
VQSEYYPRRARWYSRFLVPWFAVRRALHLERIRLPSGLSTVQFILSLIIPGYAFFANGRRVLGWAFVAVYCNAVILFIVALGYQIGGVGYGLMIAAHASSIVFLEGYWLRDQCQFQIRLVLAGLTLLVVWLGIYAQLIGCVERHWIMPLRVRGNVVIVQRMTSPRGVKRGDPVMYSLNATHNALVHNEAVYVEGGFGWGPVLAVAGDRVEFSTNKFIVNGETRALLPHMPQGGELAVPEKHWFIWPEFDMLGHGNVGEANLSAMMMELATVPEDQFVGKPFKRWFGRRQIL